MSSIDYLAKIDREIKREEKMMKFFAKHRGKKLLGLLMLGAGLINGILWTAFYMITEYKQMIEGWVPKENFILRLVTGCAYQIVVFGALYGWMIYSSMKRKYTIKAKDI